MLITFPWKAIWSYAHWSKKGAAITTVIKKSVSLWLMWRLRREVVSVDKLKHWTSWEHHVKSFGAKETRSKTLSEDLIGNIFKTWQTQYHLMTPFKTTFCISCCSINLLYLPNSPLLVWTQNLPSHCKTFTRMCEVCLWPWDAAQGSAQPSSRYHRN